MTQSSNTSTKVSAKSLASLTFYGAAGTVTGSKYLLKAGQRQVLLEAGLFQGLKELRLRNWQRPPFDPAALSSVVLSHAHVDHSGYLPLLAREKFRGKVYCTSGTADLVKILLLDAAHLQEEEAAFANRHGYSKHHPALPLYTVEDAEAVLKLIETKPYGTPFPVSDNISALFRRAGHILGSAIVELEIRPNADKRHKIVFSGDLGRSEHPILRDPEFSFEADTLLIEATYGDRVHPKDAKEQLAKVIQGAIKRGGVLLIPAFAVGRTQDVVWYLNKLEEEKKIPAIPVYIDSPMAIRASEIYSRHPEDHDLEMSSLMKDKNALRSQKLQWVRTPEESKKLNELKGPAIIISASGMATGGRILHHLRQRLPDPRTTVMFAGYQAVGTRGRALQDGAKKIRMFGEEVPVAAKIEVLSGLSAHADREDILRWLSAFKRPPGQTFIIHGEPKSSEALREAIRAKWGWKVRVARDNEKVDLC